MTKPYSDPFGVHTPTTGTSPPASWGTSVANNLQTISAPPGCKVVTSAAQATASGTFLFVAFAAADIRDTDAYHDIVTNNTRMTVPTGMGGIYRLTAHVEWQINATGQRLLGYRVTGVTTTWMESRVGVTTFETRQSGSEEIALVAGDYVEIVAMQNSGAGLNVNLARASLTWLGRA